MKLIFLSGIFLSALSCSTSKSHLKFNDLSPRGYSQSVACDLSRAAMIFISGQVPVDEKGELVGKDDLEKQTEQVFENIQKQLEKAGGSMNDVVKIDCYFKNISDIAAFRKARDRYINHDFPPASTAIQIERLVNPDFLIEIDAIAMIRH